MGFNLKKILQALLFSTSEPLSIRDIQAVIQRYHSERETSKSAAAKNSADSEILETGSETNANTEEMDAEENGQGVIRDIIDQVPTLLTATQIREAMEEISTELEESGSVYSLLQSSSGFKFAISKQYSEWVRLLRDDPRPQKLTRAALETLAIVAYRQPVTRAEIEAIRGVNSDGPLSRLVDKNLVFISGRADLPGRPVQYATTQDFLDFIGANSLDELPSSDVLSPGQISEWIRRASNPSNIGDADVGLSDMKDSTEGNPASDSKNSEASPVNPPREEDLFAEEKEGENAAQPAPEDSFDNTADSTYGNPQAENSGEDAGHDGSGAGR